MIALLKSYNPGPGDTVYIDTGSYFEVRNVVISGNLSIGTGAGATYIGPVNHVATLNRGNMNSYATDIELNDAGSVTMSNLTLTDANTGLWLHNESIRFTGTNLTFADNAGNGMTVASDSSQSTFGYLTAYGNGGDGINISTAIASLSNSKAYDNRDDGLDLTSQGAVLVQNDTTYGNGTGIYLSARARRSRTTRLTATPRE